MKAIQLTLISLALVFTTSGVRADSSMGHDNGMMKNDSGASTEKPKAEKEGKKSPTYKCPMDGYTSTKSSKCPKCGMTLERMSAIPGGKKAPLETVKYRCSMDGYESDAPGKCPKCGMDLEKQTMTSPKTKECKDGQAC